MIDPSLAVLEWAKAALGAVLPRVHVFQRAGLGIERIRQYLARAELPLVLIAHDVPADPASGARDATEIVARLKRQAPGMTVLLVHDEGGAPPHTRRGVQPDGFAQRPAPPLLVDPRAGRQRMRVASALQDTLERAIAEQASAPAGLRRHAPASEDLARLRETSARIRDGAGRGEVLSQVLDFAAQRFSRVALFGVQGERAVGVAQLGLSRAGGPDDAVLRELALASREPAWFRRVIETRQPLRSAPTDAGDQRLAVLLGNEIPLEAYVAPIVTGERVVALLYADNLPGCEPLADSGSLEVLLDAAGIALDRAVLERTLAEAGEIQERRPGGFQPGPTRPKPARDHAAEVGATPQESDRERRSLPSLLEAEWGTRATHPRGRGLGRDARSDRRRARRARREARDRRGGERLRGAASAAAPELRPDRHRHQHARHQRARAGLLREEGSALPKYQLLIVSTEGSERDRDKGLALGASAYLVKPFAADELRRLVRGLLPARSSRS